MRSVPHRGSGWVLLAVTNVRDCEQNLLLRTAACVMSVGPTRYRDVVLTSWARRMCDCEGSTRRDGGMRYERRTHPLPRCGTDLMGPQH
jgi:hypothetical protein